MNKSKSDIGNHEIRSKTKIQSFGLDYDTFNIKSARIRSVGTRVQAQIKRENSKSLKPLMFEKPF